LPELLKKSPPSADPAADLTIEQGSDVKKEPKPRDHESIVEENPKKFHIIRAM
jgi:hypothetical protein